MSDIKLALVKKVFSGLINRDQNRFKQRIHSPFLVVLACLFTLNFSHGALAESISLKKHSQVWQDLIVELPEDKGVFNRSLRNSTRESLELIDLSSIEAVDEAILKQKLIPRLKKLDADLSKYVRVSERTKSFEQLKKLMPALKNIEERKLIERLLKQQSIRPPNLRNSRLLPFLDKRITRLANSMIFNMKALVRERRPNEAELLKAMMLYGVEFSARPPDFFLDYSVVSNGQNDNSEHSFDTEITLLNRFHIPVVSVNELVVTEAETEEMALKNALEVMAKLVTMQLKVYLLESPLK